MKHYIRVCVSLDQETINKANYLAMYLGTSVSGVIKEAIKNLHQHKSIWDK